MSEQNRSFALFVLGAVLFAVAFTTDAFARGLTPDNKMMLCIAFFSLPYLLWEFTRKINWWVVLYLALLLSLYYMVAYAAGLSVWGRGTETNPNALLPSFLPAFVLGGLTGGALSLLTLRFRGLRSGESRLSLIVIGIVVLTVLPVAGHYLSETEVGGENAIVLWLFLPWQIALGWFISRLMRISPPKGAAAA